MSEDAEFDDFTSVPEPVEALPEEKPSDEEIAEVAFNESLNKTLGVEEKPGPTPELDRSLQLDELEALKSKANRVDDLEQQLSKLHDKAFGTIGQLKQTIDGLKATKSTLGKAQVTKDNFKHVRDYFDDEALAEAIANDFANIQFNQTDYSEQINTTVQNLERKFEQKLLDAVHPDWKELANTDEFESWKSTLKPEALNTLQHSWDGAVLAKAFTQFKVWRSDKQATQAQKEQRLKDAIPVGRGASAGATSMDDPFMAGFKKVQAQRLR